MNKNTKNKKIKIKKNEIWRNNVHQNFILFRIPEQTYWTFTDAVHVY